VDCDERDFCFNVITRQALVLVAILLYQYFDLLLRFYFMKKVLSSFFISFFLLLSIQPSFAHFHYEAAATTVLQTNKDNQLSALDISWVYDPEVSDMMLKDNDDLKSFGKGLMNDLNKLGYFTLLKLNNKIIKTSKVETFKLEKIGKDKESYLKLSFTLPITSPVELKGKNTLTIDHTDTSASAIIYYDTASSISFSKTLDPHCIANVKDKKDYEHGETPQSVNVFCEI